jgi:uncharacterized protein (TIGR02284 family)
MEASMEKDIDKLNSFLRGELSAVETYRQCIEKVSNPSVRDALVELQQSHQDRVQKLQERIQMLGGEAETSSGPWGSFAKIMQGGAAAFGEKSAVSMLEEGEDHGRDDYERDVDKLSPSNQEFVRQEILPEQHKTHDALSRIQDMA